MCTVAKSTVISKGGLTLWVLTEACVSGALCPCEHPGLTSLLPMSDMADLPCAVGLARRTLLISICTFHTEEAREHHVLMVCFLLADLRA